jgi:uncharacterized membrane protein
LGVGVQAVPYGPQFLPPEILTAVSADGQTFVGYGYSPNLGNEIFKWTVGQPQLVIVPRVAGTLGGFASAASNDISVIVGTQVIQSTPRIQKAARWVNGVGALLTMIPGATASEGVAVSADGSVVGGQVVTPGRADAYLWTEADGMKLIGAHEAGLTDSIVDDLSATGDVAVGHGTFNGRSHGFYWTSAQGLKLADELLERAGADLGEYSVFGINAVSDDGLTFVGAAVRSSGGLLEPFIARIPEPNAWALIVVSLPALVILQRRGGRSKR